MTKSESRSRDDNDSLLAITVWNSEHHDWISQLTRLQEYMISFYYSGLWSSSSKWNPPSRFVHLVQLWMSPCPSWKSMCGSAVLRTHSFVLRYKRTKCKSTVLFERMLLVILWLNCLWKELSETDGSSVVWCGVWKMCESLWLRR